MPWGCEFAAQENLVCEFRKDREFDFFGRQGLVLGRDFVTATSLA